MKEFSLYLFLLLFIYVKLDDFEKEIKNEPVPILENNIAINYVNIGDKNFLLNPRSDKVVLFKTSSTPAFRNLESNNNEEIIEDYLDLLKLNIKPNSEEITLNINNKDISFATYTYESEINFGNIKGYIGIKDKSEFAKKTDFSDKHSYRKYFENKGEKIDKFGFGKEISQDDYDDNSIDFDLVTIEPSLKDGEELSLSLSHFTFKDKDQIYKKYQYQIEDDNDNYIDTEKKVFISLTITNYHIAPNDWIKTIVEKGKLKIEKTETLQYFNKQLTKYSLTVTPDSPNNFNLIFDSSSSINVKLINEKNVLTFLGYDKDDFDDGNDSIYLSNTLLNYSVNYNFGDEILSIIGDDEKITDIESFVPVILFIISCVIVVIIIIGVIIIIRKNKNNNISVDNQDNNNTGLVPN
jgi:hypothetical protein